MLKRVLIILLLVSVSSIVFAADIKISSHEFTPIFSSLPLMMNIVVQMNLGDAKLLQSAIVRGDAVNIGKGKKYMILDQTPEIMEIAVGGYPGVWYTSKYLWE